MGTDRGVDKGDDKPRRTRKYTLSELALAQRRTAAWKHGERANGALAQAIPPCKKSLCPMSDPDEKGNCSLKRQVEAEGGALERCAPRLVFDEDVRRRFVVAIQKGEIEGLGELQGTLLAGLHGLTVQELAKMLEEGLAIDRDVFNKDGDFIGSVKATNPRAEPLLKLVEIVGATAAQQAVTPKSAGERKRDEGLGSMLELYKRRNQLAGAKAGDE